MGDFGYGPDFIFFPQKDERLILQYLCKVAANLYQDGEDVQVISLYKSYGILSVASLNKHFITQQRSEKSYGT